MSDARCNRKWNRVAMGNVAVLVALAALAAAGCQSTPAPQAPAPEPPAPEPVVQVPAPAPGDEEILYFDEGSSALTTEHRSTLQELAERMTPVPSLRLHVVGYAASTEQSKANKWLSEQRAKNVASFLAYEGIAPEKLTLQGGGESTDPTASTGAGRAVVMLR